MDRLSQLSNKYDVRVLWQPFSAKAAGQGFQGSRITSERASYIREDVARLAQSMELPIVVRADWPEKEFDPERSIRGAVVAGDLDIVLEYNIKMFDRWWAEGLEPNDQAFFIQLCDELDVDPNEFAGRMSTTDTRERVRGLFKRGQKLQIFDTPTVVIGEERYWGLDRLDMVEEKLAGLGVKKPAWL